MKRTSAALMAVPLAASMLLVGCGGDAKPDPPSSSTPTSSPTTTAVPTTTASPTTDPNIPAAARAHTPAGAEAFTKYFFERLNLAWTAPRAGILSPLCQQSAIACTAFENTATRLTTQGHHYDGNPVTVKLVGALDGQTLKKLDVLANVVQEPRREIDGTGKVYVTDKRKNLQFDIELVFSGQTWSISSINLMK